MEPYAALSSVDILDLQVGHLSHSIPRRRHEKGHGLVADANGSVHIERREKSRDLFLPEVLGNARQPPMGHRGNGILEGKLYLTPEPQEPEESPKGGAQYDLTV